MSCSQLKSYFVFCVISWFYLSGLRFCVRLTCGVLFLVATSMFGCLRSGFEWCWSVFSLLFPLPGSCAVVSSLVFFPLSMPSPEFVWGLCVLAVRWVFFLSHPPFPPALWRCFPFGGAVPGLFLVLGRPVLRFLLGNGASGGQAGPLGLS